MKHTQDEIVARLEEVRASGNDIFGARSQELIYALDFEHAKPYLVETASKETWAYADSDERIRTDAKSYLEFAIGKAEDHRGLSAGRSIDHYISWVWLLAPERFEEFERTEYAQYGAPKLKAAAEILGFPEEWARLVPEGSPADRMSQGLRCEDDCDAGCDS